MKRTLQSATARVKIDLKKCVRFAACVKSVKLLNRSGHSDEDEVCLATALFKKPDVSHPPEGIGKAFRFFDFWVLLRDMAKSSVSLFSYFVEIECKDVSAGQQ